MELARLGLDVLSKIPQVLKHTVSSMPTGPVLVGKRIANDGTCGFKYP